MDSKDLYFDISIKIFAAKCSIQFQYNGKPPNISCFLIPKLNKCVQLIFKSYEIYIG